MHSSSSRSVVFVVRLWQNEDDSASPWHASVDCPSTAERHYFADPQALCRFLRCRCTQSEAATPLEWLTTPDATITIDDSLSLSGDPGQ